MDPRPARQGPVDPRETLDGLGVLDGDQLVLRRRAEAAPPRSTTTSWTPSPSPPRRATGPGARAGRARSGLAGAGVAGAVARGAVAAGRGPGTAGGLVTAGAAALLAVLAAVLGASSARLFSRPGPAAVLGLLATGAGAVCGLAAVPSETGDAGPLTTGAGTPHLLLAAALALVAAGSTLLGTARADRVALAVLVGLATAAGIATAVGAVATVVGALATARGAQVDPPAVAAGAGAVALVVLSALPRLGIALARLPLPQVPASAAELAEDAGPGDPAALDRRADRAHAVLAGLAGGTVAVLAAAAAVLAAQPGDGWRGTAGWVLAALLVVLPALRSRSYANALPATILLVGRPRGRRGRRDRGGGRGPGRGGARRARGRGGRRGRARGAARLGAAGTPLLPGRAPDRGPARGGRDRGRHPARARGVRPLLGGAAAVSAGPPVSAVSRTSAAVLVVLTALLVTAGPALAQDVGGHGVGGPGRRWPGRRGGPARPAAARRGRPRGSPHRTRRAAGPGPARAVPRRGGPGRVRGAHPEPDAVPGADARGVTVAVVDSGVAVHPRLAGGVVDGGDFVAGRSATADCDGHGTAVAGVVAAAPGGDDGVSGVAPGVRIVAVRADSAWSGAAGAAEAGDEATLARAVRAAAARPGVGVVTLAVAACRPAAALVGGTDPALGALRAAVHDAATRGIVVVAAAGNVGPACPANDPAQARERLTTVPAPGWFDDDVLTVGALDDAGHPDPASLAGPWVDLAAPGDVPAALDARSGGLTADLTLPGSAPGPVTGTSFAAARVAGAAALLRARFPTLPAGEIVARLVGTAAPVPGAGPGRDPVVGAGALDVRAALAGARPPVAPAPSPPPDGDGVLPWVAAGTVVVVLAVAGLLLVRRRSAR